MNREHKYRAWDAKNQKMYFSHGDCDECKRVQLFHGAWEVDIMFPSGDDAGTILCDGKHAILMKFTGELDKHGASVYEGDVCRFYEYPDEPLFFHGLAYIDNDRVGGRWKIIKCNNESLDSSSFWNDDYEIIGNIYENPELLNED